MDRFPRALLVAGLFLLAMTRSGSGDKVQKSKIGFAECRAFRRSQWTTLPHPDMQCRVFILKTGGFLTAAAIDARWRICLRRHDMAAGFHHRHDLSSANATKKFRAGTLLRQAQQPVTALNSKPKLLPHHLLNTYSVLGHYTQEI